MCIMSTHVSIFLSSFFSDPKENSLLLVPFSTLQVFICSDSLI